MALLTSCMQQLRVNHAGASTGPSSISACLLDAYTSAIQMAGKVCQSLVNAAQKGHQLAPFSHVSGTVV